MRKPTSTKLTLNKDTLRTLSTKQLSAAAGGQSNNTCQTSATQRSMSGCSL